MRGLGVAHTHSHVLLPCWRGRSLLAPRRVSAVTRSSPEDIFGKLKDKSYLDAAAKRFALGVENDLDEDELVAMEFGASSVSRLTDIQRQYMGKVKERLQKRAAEMKAAEEEQRARQAKNFMLGKEAYECGEYRASVRLLEIGVEEAGRDTQMGGEAQLWLALAYQACGREQDAIDACKYVEANHPIRKIKKQAENLRYILEAPKLELSEDEIVKIPLIESYSWRKGERKSLPNNKLAKPKEPQSTSYWDKVDWDIPIPSFVPNRWYYQVAWGVCILLLIVYVNSKATGTGA